MEAAARNCSRALARRSRVTSWKATTAPTVRPPRRIGAELYRIGNFVPSRRVKRSSSERNGSPVRITASTRHVSVPPQVPSSFEQRSARCIGLPMSSRARKPSIRSAAAFANVIFPAASMA